MTLKQALAALERAGTAQNRKVYARHGVRDPMYGVSFAMGGKLRAELYIDSGDGDSNLALFEDILQHKPAIETQVGEELSWEELQGRRACRIAIYGLGDVLETDKHDAFIDWMFDRSHRLRVALKPIAAQLTSDG